MSASRDNLPVVEEKPPAPTVIGTLWEIANWVAKRELLMRLVMVVVLIAVGVAGLAYAQDAGVKWLAPVEQRVTALEKNQADMQRMTLETNATVKMIAYRLGVTPLTLEQPKDAGQ